MSRVAVGWLALFIIGICTPVVIALADGAGDPVTLWSTLTVLTGTQAVIALVFALVAVARVRAITAGLGIDGAMGAHRVLGSAAAALAAVHVVTVIADNPSNVWLLDAFVAPNRAAAGTIALIALAVLVTTADRRSRFYEWWRWAHRAVAAAAFTLVALHIWWLDRLIHTPAWATLFSAVVLGALLAFSWRWLAPGRRGKFIVAEMWAETDTVATMALVPCGHPPAFEAGQFAWLRLRPEPWAQDHPFTMSSAADGAHEWEFTFRHVGDWTGGSLSRLRPGAAVWVDGPHGAMTLASADGAPGIVMVAAGVGLTPALSMLRTLAERGDERPVVVVTPPDEPLFRDELIRLTGVLDLTVVRALSRPLTADGLGSALPDRAWVVRASYFVCGPPSMVSDAVDALTALGITAGQIHSEQFEIA